MSDLDINAARQCPVPDDIETVAQGHASTALASLVKVMVSGATDPARVNAAVAVLNRGFGKPSTDAGGMSDMFAGLLPVRAGLAAAKAIRDAARAQATLAIEVLYRIATASESEGARVSAARALLDRGCGAVAPAKVPEEISRGPLGKREQQQADARAAAQGLYAVPEPPAAGSDKLQ